MLSGKAIQLNCQLKNGILLSDSGKRIKVDYRNVKSTRVKNIGAKVLFDLNNDQTEAVNVIFVAETVGTSGDKRP